MQVFPSCSECRFRSEGSGDIVGCVFVGGDLQDKQGGR